MGSQVDGEAGCQKLWGHLDGGSDLEVEVFGEPGVVGSPELVRVAAFDNPLPRRGDRQSGEEPVDRDDEMDPASDDTRVASGVDHSDEEARPSPCSAACSVVK